MIMETAQENKVATTVKDSEVIWHALFTTKMQLLGIKIPVPPITVRIEPSEVIEVPREELLDIIERLLGDSRVVNDFEQFEYDIIWNALEIFREQIYHAKKIGDPIFMAVKDGCSNTVKKYEKEDLRKLHDKVCKLRSFFA